ncbi:hypothetical protein GMDG_08494 [Pseudogymnoascus destructans 20631-21]|uniref:FAS1 domain-containing protein n=1 Tax=Pseudogymnoascus destructans (strain ATCC MYA-4855 / 20631-21) TaxID=658429 RepID=L8G4C2_PSED2|nr:hypothetical protein GMDG_08494 [Pseudogymnoascus destructans 20631-21]
MKLINILQLIAISMAFVVPEEAEIGQQKFAPKKTSKTLENFYKLTTELNKVINDDLVQLLNSTETNYTIFAPTNDAFKHLPGSPWVS